MRFHENFTRCQCGHAYLRKEVYVLASYTTDSKTKRVTNFNELPEGSETRYICNECNALIYTKRE